MESHLDVLGFDFNFFKNRYAVQAALIEIEGIRFYLIKPGIYIALKSSNTRQELALFEKEPTPETWYRSEFKILSFIHTENQVKIENHKEISLTQTNLEFQLFVNDIIRIIHSDLIYKIGLRRKQKAA